jgi:Fe2+ or Zn2+ uptake regulation protein
MIERSTRYVKDVQDFLGHVGHATNIEILEHLQKTYTDVSATTVHRITARLVERGKLSLAPAAKGNVMRFDANTESHDHFLCSNCDMLRDTDVADDIRPLIEKSIGDGCKISGNLVISGLCKKCNKELNK